jgi:histone H3/H4
MIMEIRKMQRCTKPLMRFASFTRLVRERGRLIVLKIVGGKMEQNGVRYKIAAMEMLREMMEVWMVRIMEDALLCCLHRKVKGVQVKDIRLAERIRAKSRPTDWVREHLTAKRVAAVD